MFKLIEPKPIARRGVSRGAIWAATAFYGLVALEFIYMATPFAVYFYSVYSPFLEWLNRWPQLSWLGGVFLPHIVVETASPLLDLRNTVGGALVASGLAAFSVAALQVYIGKLTGRGVVVSGLYRLTRHPQYLALSVAGFGMVILWPRFVALVAFVLMVGAYRLLARLEERACAESHGAAYQAYAGRTPRWWPLSAGDKGAAAELPSLQGALRGGLVIVAALVVAVGAAWVLRGWTLRQIAVAYTASSATVSVGWLDDETLRQAMDLASRDPQVRRLRAAALASGHEAFVDYLLPADWYAPEIPMNRPPESPSDHHHPVASDRALQRLVLTAVDVAPRYVRGGRSILEHGGRRVPLGEVLVDLRRNEIIAVQAPVSQFFYGGILVPLF